jgi:hypothetical protein
MYLLIFHWDHYETQIKTLQDRHRKEERALKQENQKLKNDFRVQKVSFAYVQTNL